MHAMHHLRHVPGTHLQALLDNIDGHHARVIDYRCCNACSSHRQRMVLLIHIGPKSLLAGLVSSKVERMRWPGHAQEVDACVMSLLSQASPEIGLLCVCMSSTGTQPASEEGLCAAGMVNDGSMTVKRRSSEPAPNAVIDEVSFINPQIE